MKQITIRVDSYEGLIIVNALRAIGVRWLADRIVHADATADGPEVDILREKNNG